MDDALMPPVAADQMRIAVEIGEEYEPSDRIAAALTELHSALAEDSEEVAGFGMFDLTPVSFIYDSSRSGGFGPVGDMSWDNVKNIPWGDH